MRWLLCASVVLCVAASNANHRLPWWKTANLYQVYPRSFKDSNGDGIGDLRGILESAGYFKEIGVDAIWLSPIYKSPMADLGYDISNYTDIDPIFGTMDDFDAVASKMNETGIKLLMDFVPNHTSDEHPWFQISRDPSHPLHKDYRDFYVWKHPKRWDDNTTPVPPNNWRSIFGGSVWEWCPERQQYYFHNFLTKQPDLNYRSRHVIGNITAVLKFWMDKGVDGFRMDAVPWLVENFKELHNPRQDQSFYTQNQPGTYALLQHWNDVVHRRFLADGKQRAMLMEVYQNVGTTMRYYGNGNHSISYPFNFYLMYLDQYRQYPSEYRDVINLWMNNMPEGRVANWVVGNHDQKRLATRCGAEMVDAINMLTMVLPGVKVSYYGEEIGMQDTFVRYDQKVDHTPAARDPCRTPMQWDTTRSAGFSSNPKPWLPVNPNYWYLNVAAQKAANSSHLKVFQTMAQARKDPVLQRGDLNVLVPNDYTLLVVRSYNESKFILVINMGSEEVPYTSQDFFAPNNLDVDMEMVVCSVNSGYDPGMTVSQGSANLTLKPKTAMLLKTTIPSLDNSTTLRRHAPARFRLHL